MKFSVLVPVYNTSEYLEQCIVSLLSQTFDDFEIIIVNDGSTDNSGDMCDRYQSAYPQKIRVIHKNNQGLLAARRDAIKVARGEYCIFVDSDDFVETNLLCKVNEFIEKNRVDVAIYSFRYYRNEENQQVFSQISKNGKVWKDEEKTELYEKLISTNDVTQIWTKAVRTEILQNEPTDYTKYYGKNMAEDLLQSLYILTAAQSVGYIYEPLYLYRINDNSISRSFRPQTVLSKNTLHVYEEILKYLEIWGLNDKEHFERTNARWFNETLYLFVKYYESAKNRMDRNTILNIDWNSLLPIDARVNRNQYENSVYQKIYTWWSNKKYSKIYFFFVKNKIIKKLRAIKSKFLI